ncbi:glycosyltransferase [Pantoea allii]|uniref:glycosyltransferase n=1 Tax=Pantoea allii TaxID=574096 RepID=UPI0039774007
MSKAIKILFVVEKLRGQGGMENVTRQVVEQFNINGFDAGLFVLDSKESIKSDNWCDGIQWAFSRCVTRNKKISDFVHVLRLAKFIRKNKITRVIALNTVPCFIARKAINLSRQKSILYTWMHLPPKNRYRPHYLLKADEHLAISNEIKKQLIDLGARPEHIHVIFNPVQSTNVSIHRPVSARFLFIGRVHFEEQKQLKDLFDALKNIEGQWTLDIVGDGPDIDRCQAYVEALGIANNIRWHGWQVSPWNYVLQVLQEVSCLVLTSKHEGFPLTLLEAMARGVFCVSSDCVSGPSEIITEGTNGLLYQVNDIAHLSNILQNIVDGYAFPSIETIKSSVKDFYLEYYMDRVKKIMIRES